MCGVDIWILERVGFLYEMLLLCLVWEITTVFELIKQCFQRRYLLTVVSRQRSVARLPGRAVACSSLCIR
jgi:hypothetical protein